MDLHQPNAHIFIPDGSPAAVALARTTHLAIGAHQDDLEIMAIHGIQACYQEEGRWFTGVTVTDGRGSPRQGAYKDYTDESMAKVRVEEQNEAAKLGEYSAQVNLDYGSTAVKDGDNGQPADDLAAVLRVAQPEIVYTHNLADKHDTHVALALKTIDALRTLDRDAQPRTVYGCEVWRDLDWLPEGDKVSLDVSGYEDLQEELVRVFESQVVGGKRYDIAALSRRQAHATFSESHATDAATGLTHAMDLTPLMLDPTISPTDYMQDLVGRFNADISKRIARMGKGGAG